MRYTLESLIILTGTLAANSNLKVKWVDPTASDRKSGTMKHIGQPYTDGDNIYVVSPDPFWDNETLEEYFGSVFHEILAHNHELTNDCFEVGKDLTGVMALGLNALEDHRGEYITRNIYAGASRSIAKLRRKLIDILKENAPEYLASKKDPSLDPKVIQWSDAIDSMQIATYTCRDDWQEFLHNSGETFASSCTEQAIRWGEEILRLYKEKILSLKTAKESRELLEEINETVWRFDFNDYIRDVGKSTGAEESDREVGEASDKGKDSAEAEDGLGADSDGDSPSESEGEGRDDNEGHLEGEGEGPKTAERQFDVYYNRIKRDTKLHSESSGEGHHVIYQDSDFIHRTKYVMNPKRTILEKFPKIDPIWVDHVCSKWNFNETSISTKIKKILQFQSQTHWQGKKQRGRLSTRDLYRVGDLREDVFKKKTSNISLKNTAVSLLVDCSGSMGGSPSTAYACAAVSAAKLGETISLALRIPVEIIGFTTINDGAQPHYYLFKKFSEQISGKEVLNRFSSVHKRCSNNADGEAVMFAEERLLQRQEQKKILIVLSDGSPASTNVGDEALFLATQVRRIEKEKRISIYGIGIMDHNVERFYSNHEVINSTSDLEPAILNVVKKNFT